MTTFKEKFKNIDKWIEKHDEWKNKWLEEEFNPMSKNVQKNTAMLAAIKWLLVTLLGLNVLSISITVLLKVLKI